MEGQTVQVQQFCTIISEMMGSISSTRDAITCIKRNEQALDFKDGISLLSLKHHLILLYLQSLLLLSARRIIGDPLSTRSPTLELFSTINRSSRGGNCGDLIDSLIEGRVVLEKVKTLEARMRYQIEKLVTIAAEPEKISNFANDPLTFRPNPHNLSSQQDEIAEDEDTAGNDDKTNDLNTHITEDEIYRPPRIAPTPYLVSSNSQKRKERPPVPSALASLSSDPARPHIESTSGLGSTPSLVSGRAAYLKRLNEFEEANFSRVVMKKSDAKKRARDEENLALGGSLSGQSRSRAGGLEDEFGEILRSVERASGNNFSRAKSDGYDDLRKRGKKAAILDRSRQSSGARKRDNSFDDIDTHGSERKAAKRSRFELEMKTVKKKLAKGK